MPVRREPDRGANPANRPRSTDPSGCEIDFAPARNLAVFSGQRRTHELKKHVSLAERRIPDFSLLGIHEYLQRLSGDRFATQIGASRILEEHDLKASRYFLVTAHRSENVDHEDRLRNLLAGLRLLHQEYGYPVIYPLHPRTRSRAASAGIDLNGEGIRLIPPLGFFDFVRLEQNAFCILSDSGTVQEEACLFGVPNVTLREVTERPETLECGSNILSGVNPLMITSAVHMVTSQSGSWLPPREYLEPAVAEAVCRIVLGFRIPDAAETAWRKTTCASCC